MSSAGKLKLITAKDQIDAGCVNYDSIISVIEDSFRLFQNGKVILPEKISQIFNQQTQDRINCMPSTLLTQGVCGVKWISVFPSNPQSFGIPTVSGIIVLSEIENGLPIAILEGTLITELRTAAVGAIGAKYLARADSTVYGTIGAGKQAKMHFKLIKHILPHIHTCYVASRTQKSENNFIEEMKRQYCDVKFIPCNSNYDIASQNADIIVTAVSCQKPLLKANTVKNGAYYCHVGGWEDEYDVPLKANKIVCDDWKALKHRGSPTLAKLYKQGRLRDEDIYGNIAELICGFKPGRENDDEFVYFNSIGLSFVDVAVAHSFYSKVIEEGFGQDWSM